MGVYIKGMEMPKDCFRCPIWDIEYGRCRVTARITNCKKDCPLVEVKTPHGRVIDADEFLKDMNCGILSWSALDGVSAITALTKIMSNSHYVPTVIEAEGKDNYHKKDTNTKKSCETCVHNPVCKLWRQEECQDASNYSYGPDCCYYT